MTTRLFYRVIAPLAVTLLIVASLVRTGSGQANGGAVATDNDDIGGVVSGARGPEAGVWVIAETRDLPTKLAKIVVTDDQGRYLIPDLPKANYDVWVRGYGLVDSPKTQSAPGRTVNLKAVAAPDAKSAAEYYPAQYLVGPAAGSAAQRLPWHRPARQWDRSDDAEPGRVHPQHHQHRRLHWMPSARQQGDA